MGEKLDGKLGESEVKILVLLEQDPYMPITKLPEEIGISITWVEKNIKKLKEKGLLRRVGPAKGGHWEISEDND